MSTLNYSFYVDRYSKEEATQWYLYFVTNDLLCGDLAFGSKRARFLDEIQAATGLRAQAFDSYVPYV